MHWLFIILAHFLPITDLENETGEGFREYRGFLARDGNGQVYLTDSPHLHSCCVGNGKRLELLLVNFDLNPLPQHVAQVKGNLTRREGKYSLEQVEYVPETEGSLWLWAGLTLLAGCGFLILRR